MIIGAGLTFLLLNRIGHETKTTYRDLHLFKRDVKANPYVENCMPVYHAALSVSASGG
jgi:hypothetical protein